MGILQAKSVISGQNVAYKDEVIGTGAMKDVYFSPDKSYVVGFFREELDATGQDRLLTIVKTYREKIFNSIGGQYWEDLYCWPTDIVEKDGKWGVVAPSFQKHFFFEHGSINNDMLDIKGKEKEGKWFASGKLRNQFLAPEEKGDFLSYLRICLLISRAVRRMHAAGLAHSDLSYKNVLVDPVKQKACIIDIDGLVVPGKYPPDVMGTPDFIAPEVIMSKHLPVGDPNRCLPTIYTDRHALAVLIYMYLFFRHPLRGKKIHDQDPVKDEEMTMGSHALFVEHPTDHSNRVNPNDLKKAEQITGDPEKTPYTNAGPYLQELFDRAFIDGLQDPMKRPTADEWEQALVKTVDLLQPCQNKDCNEKWFVFDNTTKPSCPHCKTAYNGLLPVLNLYSTRGVNNFRSDNHRLMVYSEQGLYAWHENRNVFPNEKLTDQHKIRLGYFLFHQGKWLIVNENFSALYDVSDPQNKKQILQGKFAELKDGQQLLLSSADGGRLIHVQMVSN